MLFHIPNDLEYFKNTTLNQVVVMGRKTFLSLPNGPLKNRVNIVLSTDPSFETQGIIKCDSINSVLDTIKNYSCDIYIIGGQSVYEAFLPLCSEVLVTKVLKDCPADTFFPNLDSNQNWQECEKSQIFTQNHLNYYFCKYINLYQSREG